MTTIEAFKNSNMWDGRYNLPTSTQNNNPWFYMACAQLVCPESVSASAVMDYYRLCLNGNGTINRWPSSPSEISQDELIGAAHLSPVIASEQYALFSRQWGYYSNTDWHSLGAWYGRFPWFMSYMKLSAGQALNFWDRLMWNLHVQLDMLLTKPGTLDSSGRLLIWVMGQTMKVDPACAPMFSKWKLDMNEKGITPKAMLTLEPKENPVMAQFAPDLW